MAHVQKQQRRRQDQPRNHKWTFLGIFVLLRVSDTGGALLPVSLDSVLATKCEVLTVCSVLNRFCWRSQSQRRHSSEPVSSTSDSRISKRPRYGECIRDRSVVSNLTMRIKEPLYSRGPLMWMPLVLGCQTMGMIDKNHKGTSVSYVMLHMRSKVHVLYGFDFVFFWIL